MSVGRGCNCALADCGMNAGVMCPCMEGNKLIYLMESTITLGAVYIGKRGLYLIGGKKDSLGHWEG